VKAHLSKFRKPDCPYGRITNGEDFKHVARKVTCLPISVVLGPMRSEAVVYVNVAPPPTVAGSKLMTQSHILTHPVSFHAPYARVRAPHVRGGRTDGRLRTPLSRRS